MADIEETAEDSIRRDMLGRAANIAFNIETLNLIMIYLENIPDELARFDEARSFISGEQTLSISAWLDAEQPRWLH